jgi:hypothetical protein
MGKDVVTYTEDWDLYVALRDMKGVEKFGTYRDHKRGIFAWQVRYPKRLIGKVANEKNVRRQAQEVPVCE